jgi:hypothetical protein
MVPWSLTTVGLSAYRRSLWQRQGRRDDARRTLAEAARWISEDIETSALRDARRLLDQLA